MKKTLSFVAAGMLLLGGNLFAVESTVIDFTLLDADCVADENGNMTQNKRTVVDFSNAAGLSYTAEQKALMKSSLALPEWEVTLNSSAKSVKALGLSTVVSAPVKSDANVPFAGKNVMGVRVIFPEWNNNASAFIKPAFEIPMYEPLSSADDNGVRQAQSDEEKASGKVLFEDGYGVVSNVGTVKSIAVTTLGMNYPHGLYVMFEDSDGVQKRYYMGNLEFDGWKTLIWNNPSYIADIKNREIRVYPVYPRGMPSLKFIGFQVTRDASHIGGDFIGYFKDVKMIYDKAYLTTERDIADEDVWGILGKREAEKQAFEMMHFGEKQVERYMEKAKQAKESEFTSSLEAENASGSSASVQ